MPIWFSNLLCKLVLASITFSMSIALANANQIVRLVEMGKFDQAQIELAKNNPKPYEVAFLNGLIAKRQNRLDIAELMFRRSLSLNPNFGPAKRELAHTLLLVGNDAGAKVHFESLAANAANDVERNSYDRFLEAIKSKRPYGFNGYFGFLPSTNANKGSGKDVFITEFGEFKINDSSKQESGIGISTGVSGFYKKKLGSTYNFLFSGAVDSLLYENSVLNNIKISTNLEIGQQLGRGSYYLGITLRNTLSDWELASRKYGPTFRGTYKIDRRRHLSFSGSALRQSYPNSDYRNGYEYFASAKIKTYLTKSDSFTFGGSYRRERTERENLSHTDVGLDVSYNKQWVGGLVTNFNASYTDKNYDAAFTGLSVAREDNVTKFGITLLHSNISFKGFAPQLSYTYTRQKSNVAFYDYDSHDVGLIFTKKY